MFPLFLSFPPPHHLKPLLQVLEGNFRNMHTPGLHLISWLTGVSYERLHAIQFQPEALPEMHALRNDILETIQFQGPLILFTGETRPAAIRHAYWQIC